MTEDNDAVSDDGPIQGHADDRFGRWPFAERIAEVVRQTDSTGIVIGIYGPWGDGKTSVLNMMAQALSKHDTVIVVPLTHGISKQNAS